MSVSIYQLAYKKIARITFEWHAGDKASLLALFILLEVSLHWLWCLYVWLRQETYGSYIDMALLYPLWIGITLCGVYFWWMIGQFSRIKDHQPRFDHWQIVLIVVYSLYMATMVVIMGHSSLVSGVSLMGGTMLGVMLLRRRYVWHAFLWQILFIILITMIPYLGIKMPNLRQLTLTSLPLDTFSYLTYSETTTLENAITAILYREGSISWQAVHDLRLSSSFFWRSTHLYLALPKAIFIVYVFRILLLIIDNSKQEILQHANQDGLTNLSNRRFGLSQMQQTITATRTGQHSSVILLDLDWFKGINDKYGHEVGDQVLCEVADILTKTFSSSGIVSRYGGEEFLVILPNTGHNQAMEIADKLRKNIAQHQIKVNKYLSFQITASLGVYTLFYDELLRVKGQWAAANAQKSVDNHRTPPQKSRDKAPIIADSALHSLDKKRCKYGSNHLKVSKRARAIPHTDKRANQHIEHQQNEQLSRKICHGSISAADKALYKAKERGRNLVVSANELLGESIIPEPRFRV